MVRYNTVLSSIITWRLTHSLLQSLVLFQSACSKFTPNHNHSPALQSVHRNLAMVQMHVDTGQGMFGRATVWISRCINLSKHYCKHILPWLFFIPVSTPVNNIQTPLTLRAHNTIYLRHLPSFTHGTGAGLNGSGTFATSTELFHWHTGDNGLCRTHVFLRWVFIYQSASTTMPRHVDDALLDQFNSNACRWILSSESLFNHKFVWVFIS